MVGGKRRGRSFGIRGIQPGSAKPGWEEGSTLTPIYNIIIKPGNLSINPKGCPRAFPNLLSFRILGGRVFFSVVNFILSSIASLPLFTQFFSKLLRWFPFFVGFRFFPFASRRFKPKAAARHEAELARRHVGELGDAMDRC